MSREVDEVSSTINNRPATKRQRTNEEPNGGETIMQSDVLWLEESLYQSYLSRERLLELRDTARQLCTFGKGITACDESASTLGQRFTQVGIADNTVENRRSYRTCLLDTPGIEQYLSGAILDPETLLQKSCHTDGMFPHVLKGRGIIPGVKPHLKVYELPGTGGDTVMQGLDSLAVRARDYYRAGARFAKWRSPLVMDMTTTHKRPTLLTIQSNMKDLARYALICQSEGLMPIVEPDIVLQGTHTLQEAVRTNIQVQSELYKAMLEHGVYMAGCTLKPNMVLPGIDCPQSYTVEQLAQANVFVMEQCFPAAMPGANYLSGGQSLEQALARLNAINICAQEKKLPWNLSFSWSKAIQLPLLETCVTQGNMDLDAIGKLYLKELKLASDASKGQYTPPNTNDGAHNGKHA
uniref:fructose-bisphosphate aldolase n=1 Tax=Attheya septentrionalis TaxID=420275 RepID=A0A6T7HFW8_9STRA|mmetsp:Transcript_20820/g.37616  ORF Transcript_20820/g.37616 Transcript_20820/m.37616 type:complete len:409 (+) Transcript_20820:289-1515(+)